MAGATRGTGRGIARALGAAGALVYCTGRSDEEGRFLAWSRYRQLHQVPARREFAQMLAAALGLKDLGPGTGPARRASVIWSTAALRRS